MAKQVQKKDNDMSLAEARAYRLSMAKNPAPRYKSESERREEFRLHWAKEKAKYGKAKDIEDILWLHLKAIKMDKLEKFDEGLKHFGLKKVE